MGTIEISELLSYAVPLIIAYNVWLHNQIVKSQIEIAVNTSKDEEISRNIALLRKSVDALTTEVHSINKNTNNGG